MRRNASNGVLPIRSRTDCPMDREVSRSTALTTVPAHATGSGPKVSTSHEFRVNRARQGCVRRPVHHGAGVGEHRDRQPAVAQVAADEEGRSLDFAGRCELGLDYAQVQLRVALRRADLNGVAPAQRYGGGGGVEIEKFELPLAACWAILPPRALV